ncbi:hypothetical protein COLO4_36750 [Corchorus olitorius]|uniref:Uncharacterized protein n=1 Tax=Corchorus olitorius TaxID=93759 RepID=A0A1R3G5P2_9ROSI|nr:hypothetical protein COLO4_36750 [Corchorus olitorius]
MGEIFFFFDVCAFRYGGEGFFLFNGRESLNFLYFFHESSLLLPVFIPSPFVAEEGIRTKRLRWHNELAREMSNPFFSVFASYFNDSHLPVPNRSCIKLARTAAPILKA